MGRENRFIHGGLLDNGHLSIEEIEQLSHQKGPAENGIHVQNCLQCRSLMERYEAVSTKLEKLISAQIGARNSVTCPDDKVWFDVASGSLSEDEGLLAIQHAADCDVCGPRLKNATRRVKEQLSAEDEEILAALPSSHAPNQRRLAESLAAMATSVSPTPPKKPRNYWRPLVLAFSGFLAVLLAVAIGRKLYGEYQFSQARQLIEAEYLKGRPTPYHQAVIAYSRVGTELGSEAPKPEIRLPNSQKNPGLAAEAAFLTGDYDTAIKILESAIKSEDKSVAVLDDLVVAYAMKGDYTHDIGPYMKALEVSEQVLRDHSQDATVYFNRALIYERLDKRGDFKKALQIFLQLDKDSGWSEEARKLLSSS